jgi:hypothetical protein
VLASLPDSINPTEAALRAAATALGGRPLRFGTLVPAVYCDREGGFQVGATENASPSFTMPDIISSDFLWLLGADMRLLPSMLGGTVSLIFREGICVVWEVLGVIDVGTVRAPPKLGVEGVACDFEQVQSPSQIGHMWSSSSSAEGKLEFKFRPAAAPTVWG